MKKSIVFILCFFSIFGLMAQVEKSDSMFVSVSVIKSNSLYIGIENPVSIGITNLCGRLPSVKVSCGEIRYSGNGQYVIKVDGKCINGITLMILDSENKNDTLATYNFRCKKVPDPVIKLAGQSDSATISKNMVLAQLGIYADMADFEYDFRIKILSFAMSTRKHTEPILSETGKFSSKQYEFIKTIKPGERIYLTDVKALFPDGDIRSMPGYSFFVK